MNFKLLLKALLIVAVLALLVIMGVYNNKETATLEMPHILPSRLQSPACFMYFGFFGVGFLAGTLLMAGGKKGSSKPAKEK